MSTGQGEIVLYRAADGGPALVGCAAERESIWLTQVQMAELFGVNVPAIFKHIKSIYTAGELESGQLFQKWK